MGATKVFPCACPNLGDGRGKTRKKDGYVSLVSLKIKITPERPDNLTRRSGQCFTGLYVRDDSSSNHSHEKICSSYNTWMVVLPAKLRERSSCRLLDGPCALLDLPAMVAASTLEISGMDFSGVGAARRCTAGPSALQRSASNVQPLREALLVPAR